MTRETSWGLASVSVGYRGHGSRAALANVTVPVRPGHITAVVGGDGAGKTTALRTLAGRIIPAAGAVSAPPETAIGLMPANSGVWKDLTVDENLAFVANVYGLAASALSRRRQELLGRAELLSATTRLGSQLSGGMRQKLGLCLALLHEPTLLILDEPSTGVDPVSRVEIWRMIAEVAAGGTAVVFATTYLDEAERASTITVLDSGRELYRGDPIDVFAHVPGIVVGSDSPIPGVPHNRVWRRGRYFHAWVSDADDAGSLTPVRMNLEDAVIALTLAHESGAAHVGV